MLRAAPPHHPPALRAPPSPARGEGGPSHARQLAERAVGARGQGGLIMPGPRVLFVDDEAPLRHAVQQGLELCGHEVTCFATARLAEAQLSRNLYGVLVSDIKMPDMDGFALLRRALEIDPALPVVLVTGHGDVPLAVEAMRAGAYDFIEKPFDTPHLASVVERALRSEEHTYELPSLMSNSY